MQHRHVLLLALMGGALLYRAVRRNAFRQIAINVNEFDLPSARLYDTLFARLMGGFYRMVAREVVGTCPTGRVLEVGGGPGQLAVGLAQMPPGLTVIGVDVSHAMVERALHRVREAGRTRQVQVKVGNVAALPFPDATFDAVVSTLSLHHWAQPDRGLAESYRVLKPDQQAWIYDVPDWLSGHARPRQRGWRSWPRRAPLEAVWWKSSAGRGRFLPSVSSGCGGKRCAYDRGRATAELGRRPARRKCSTVQWGWRRLGTGQLGTRRGFRTGFRAANRTAIARMLITAIITKATE